MEDNINLNTLSVMFLGDSQVGKTSIIQSFLGNDYNENQMTTIGKECYNYLTEIKGYKVKFKIWDTAGQERFQAMSLRLVKSVEGIILVYSVENKESFKMLNKWLEQIKDNTSLEKIPIIILGNKSDVDENDRQITYEEGKEFSEEIKLHFYETSAKKGDNIKEAFNDIFEQIYLKNEDLIKGVDSKKNMVLRNQKGNNQKKKKCC